MNRASAPSSIRVLVVDDDPGITGLLKHYLDARGMQTHSTDSIAGMRALLRQRLFDVLLLDLGLPDGDGLDALRDLRGDWDGPVLILSGRGEVVERVMGLEIGADDFIDKPFDLRELLARIHAVMRRGRTDSAAASTLLLDGMRIDTAARIAYDRDGVPLALTSGEFDLLLSFARRPQQTLSRDELMNATRGRPSGPFDRAIDVQVARLRQKIERDASSPRLIQSVRGAGYRLAQRPSAD